VLFEGREVAKICSGGNSPTLGINIGSARLPRECAEPGTPIEFSVSQCDRSVTSAAGAQRSVPTAEYSETPTGDNPPS
jgi:glycine cleavage system aminomethyltransferase T